MNSSYFHPAAKKIGYSPLKFGCYCSVGLLNEKYVFEILTGICDAPEYYPISKDEFDDFDNWKDNTEHVVKEIKNRKCIYSSYK